MNMTQEQIAFVQKFTDCAEMSANAGSMRNLVFSSPSAGELLKIKGTLCVIGGNRVIQFEKKYTEGRVAQENIALSEMGTYIVSAFSESFSRVDLNDQNGSASLLRSKKGKITAVVPGRLLSALQQAPIQNIQQMLSANNRKKQYLLSGDEPFLIALGISDDAGRVHDKKQAKFRQICRFSEHIMDSVKHLPKDGSLYVADLCCGKSYLSFAAYHVLHNILQRDVKMTCIDLKESVIRFCADVADKLHFTGMEFLCADITSYVPMRSPDMVISLHACDTATDIVLDSAMRWRASVILSTPCCHRALSQNIACTPLQFITDSPILRRKFCETATDALRLMRLQCMGYTADALEFIDPEDTPKNIMLRAYLHAHIPLSSPAIQKKREEYFSAYRFLTGETSPVLPDMKNTEK